MSDHAEGETLKLTDAVRYVFEECRMVLPGIQALFGFQMIAVFNNGFSEKLTAEQQKIHGAAILLVVVAIALIMSPAALHRRAEPKTVSHRFVRVESRMVLAAMMLLALAISLELFVVMTVVWHTRSIAMITSVAFFCLLLVLWELYPTVYRLRQRRTSSGSRN